MNALDALFAASVVVVVHFAKTGQQFRQLKEPVRSIGAEHQLVPNVLRRFEPHSALSLRGGDKPRATARPATPAKVSAEQA